MNFKKILWAIALIGLLVAGYFAYFVYSAMFVPNTSFSNEEAYIYIPTDANYSEVREQLKPLLKDIEKFDALAKQKKYTSNVKPGKFVIKHGMNNNDIINSIRSNNIPVNVVFNNQPSIEELAKRVSLQIEADSSSLVKAMTDAEFLMANDLDKANAINLYLPNSYEFFWNTDAEGFRQRMLDEYQRFWNEERLSKADAIGLEPNEVMALASIVYEESKQKEEQPTVAGVYLNRLKIGMPLQADPTLKFAAYQLPEYKDKVIKRVLNIHKEIESPYNTYKYAGLPPGPVAMPDISAIDAVLNPATHNYLYFAADPERIGYHRFASTLSEHNRNARAYQQYLNSQGIRK